MVTRRKMDRILSSSIVIITIKVQRSMQSVT